MKFECNMQTKISTTPAKNLSDYIYEKCCLVLPQKQKLKAEYRKLIGNWSHKCMFCME